MKSAFTQELIVLIVVSSLKKLVDKAGHNTLTPCSLLDYQDTLTWMVGDWGFTGANNNNQVCNSDIILAEEWKKHIK